MIPFSNSSIKNLPTIYICTPNIELLPKLRGIGLRHQNGISFFIELYWKAELTSLPKTNPAAQFNYEHFTRTMAKMIQKYSDKI